MQEQMHSDDLKIKLLHSRLTDTEKGHLHAFCQNKALVAAVEKVLLYSIYEMGVIKQQDTDVMSVNWAMSVANSDKTYEEKGKDLVVLANAVGIVQDALRQVKKFGVETVVPTIEDNPAL